MRPDDTVLVARAAGAPTSLAADRDSAVGRRVRLAGRRPGLFVPLGALCGFALGVIARAWMRWISGDPEFSWAGTIFIVAAFTLFAAAQSVAAVARLRPARPGVIVTLRAVAAVLALGLFAGAGAIMLPTVLFGSLAVWRTDARWLVRVVLAIPAVPGVGLVVRDVTHEHGWTFETIGRLLLFAGIYAAVIAATWPTVAGVRHGWRPSRRLVVIVVSSVAGLLGLALYFGGVQ